MPKRAGVVQKVSKSQNETLEWTPRFLLKMNNFSCPDIINLEIDLKTRQKGGLSVENKNQSRNYHIPYSNTHGRWRWNVSIQSTPK